MNLVKTYLSDLHSDMQEAHGKKGDLSDLLLCIILFRLTPCEHKEQRNFLHHLLFSPSNKSTSSLVILVVNYCSNI